MERSLESKVLIIIKAVRVIVEVRGIGAGVLYKMEVSALVFTGAGKRLVVCC